MLIAAGALSVGRASAVTVVLLAAAGAFVGDHVRQLPGATLLAVVLAAGMTAILLFRLVRRRRHGPATGRRLVSSAENMRHAID